MCGYACINCGRCKGESRFTIAVGLCGFCGERNDPHAMRCASCGKRLTPPPGQSFSARQMREAG